MAPPFLFWGLSVTMTILLFFVFLNFLQIVQGSSPFVAGLAMLPGAAVGAVLSPFSGKMLDQYGPKKPIFAGLILSLIGWLALFLLIGHASLGVLIACHVFYMVGIGLSYSNMMTTGLNALNEDLGICKSNFRNNYLCIFFLCYDYKFF